MPAWWYFRSSFQSDNFLCSHFNKMLGILATSGRYRPVSGIYNDLFTGYISTLNSPVVVLWLCHDSFTTAFCSLEKFFITPVTGQASHWTVSLPACSLCPTIHVICHIHQAGNQFPTTLLCLYGRFSLPFLFAVSILVTSVSGPVISLSLFCLKVRPFLY